MGSVSMKKKENRSLGSNLSGLEPRPVVPNSLPYHYTTTPTRQKLRKKFKY